MNVTWPESIDERGILSRGTYFRVGAFQCDFLRTRGSRWGINAGTGDVVYIRHDGYRETRPAKHILVLSIPGYTFVAALRRSL